MAGITHNHTLPTVQVCCIDLVICLFIDAVYVIQNKQLDLKGRHRTQLYKVKYGGDAWVNDGKQQ